MSMLRAHQVLLALLLCVLPALSCKDEVRRQAGGICQQDDDCASGLICVSGLFPTARCYQQCGGRGYSGCPDDWQCGGKAWTVNSSEPTDPRTVCVPNGFQVAGDEPAGWWLEKARVPVGPSNGELSTAAFHFHKKGYDIFLPNGQFDRRSMVWMLTPTGYKGGGFQDMVILDSDLGYQLRSGRETLHLVTLSKDRIAPLQKLIDDAPDLAKTCELALACCRDAGEKLKTGCPRKSVMRSENSLQVCLDVFTYFAAKLTSSSHKVPDSCKQSPGKQRTPVPPG